MMDYLVHTDRDILNQPQYSFLPRPPATSNFKNETALSDHPGFCLSTGTAAAVDHDLVEPIPHPEAVTISEKAAVKFKRGLNIIDGCVSFPAVNAVGDTSGGLKPTKGANGCKTALKGSQVYGRAGWYQDVWAIMYA
ncbi:unnamed protein product [Phytophthora lilii]|uniref:Unnamed protein product n=1 Tax=Phytophthora lilii TaxID=2077276 RepID=A0A9W6XEN7_9STRA|nr:unnamed protein product [Phytophthora lilii]